MTAASVPSIRRNHSAEPHEAAKLTGQTCAELDRLGVRISPSKVSRLVRRYLDRSRRMPIDFGRYMAAELALDAEQEARFAWTMRNAFGVIDPTGQQAARRADKALRLGEGWTE